MSIDLIDMSRRQLEDEIRLTEQRVVELKRHLNLASVWCMLPQEILEEIFSIYAALCRAYSADSPQANHHVRKTSVIPTRLSKYSWLRVTHVCHYWRDTAIQSQRLWCYLVLTNVSCVETMLSRSGDLPLYVQCSEPLYTDRRMYTLFALKGDMYRVKSLDLIISPYRSKELAEIMHTDTPILESLTITNPPGCDHNEFKSHRILECTDWPVLRHLTLEGFSWWSIKPIFDKYSRITSLSLSYLEDKCIPMKELLTVLHSMTESLEVLELDEALPKLRVDKPAKLLPAPSGNVELRKLRSLHLGGVGYSPSYFLTHLTIPSSACLSMKYSVRGIYKPVNDQFLIPIIASRLLEDGLISDISPLLSLSFHSTPSDGMLIIRGWNDSVHSFEEAHTPAHTPKISITVPVKYQNFATSILSLTKSLLFPSTQILHLSVGQFYISPEQFLSHFPSLREIYFQGFLPDVLLCCLKQRYDRKLQKQSGTAYLQQLETIGLYDVPFTYNHRPDQECQWVGDFFDILENSSRYKVPIRRLVIRRALRLKGTVLSMKRRQSVEELDWDGMVGYEGNKVVRKHRKLLLDSDDSEDVTSEEYDTDTPETYQQPWWLPRSSDEEPMEKTWISPFNSESEDEDD